MLKIQRANFALRKFVLGFLFILFSIIFLESCAYMDESGRGFLLDYGRNSILCIVPGAVLLSGFLLFMFRCFEKMRPERIRMATWGLGVLIILIQSTVLIFLMKGGFKGVTDACRVLNQAIAMASEQKGLLDNDVPYFQKFSNNYPFTILLYYLCRGLRFMGVQCYAQVLMVLNIVMIDISGVFALKLVHMLKGRVWRAKLLLLFLLCPTTYVWIVFSYTNTFSMPFVMGTLYFGIKAMRGRKWRIGNTVLAAVLGAVGYQIRPSTIIPVVAIVIGIVLTMRIRQFREKCMLVLIIAVIFAGIMAASSAVCRMHLKNPDSDKTFPFTHWIMMGMNTEKNGFVNEEDVLFTMSFPQKEEKVKHNLKVIKKRLIQMKPAGYAALLINKLELVWGLGTDGYQGYYSNGEDISGLHQYFAGDRGGLAAVYCQIFRCVTFLFALFSVYYQLKRRGKGEIFIVSLTMLGAILFFLIWEANKKYNICFMEPALILMCDGVSRGWELARKVRRKFSAAAKRRLLRSVSVLVLLLPLFATVLMVSERKYYILDKTEHRQEVIEDRVHKEEYILLKNKGDVAEQTFTSGQAFNEVRIMQKFDREIEMGSYRFELLDGGGKLLVSQYFPHRRKSKKEWQNFDFKEIKPSGRDSRYTIRIVCEKAQAGGILTAMTPYSAYDVYSGGELTLNDRNLKRDMTFSVSRKKNESRFSVVGYIAIGVVFWLLSGLLFYLVLKKVRW